MNADSVSSHGGYARSVARHSLGWLVAANFVGALLAVLLLWPEANSLLAPFTYGRWVPLHLDWQLYGWCSLPLTGVLMAAVAGGPEHPATSCSFRLSLRIWSVTLLLGGFSWLGGTVSGKLFLDWAGWARPLLPLAMAALWFALAGALRDRWAPLHGGRKALLVSVLGVLALVPFVLYYTAGPGTFPAVNPDSGGATGTSLLGSNLGIVAVGGLLPLLLQLPRKSVSKTRTRLSLLFWPVLAGSAVWFALRPHGDVSHHEPGEIIGLGLVLAMVPVVIGHLGSFQWPVAAERWWRAAAAWWIALVASGWVIFLPGVSESVKFTHVLVAHSHLAMAGLVSSVGGAVLAALGCAPGRASAGFWWWQLGCLAHVLVLLAIG
ncbi:MAG: hypothetical protein ACHQ5A_03185, partial [Opitutales bacterium]